MALLLAFQLVVSVLFPLVHLAPLRPSRERQAPHLLPQRSFLWCRALTMRQNVWLAVLLPRLPAVLQQMLLRKMLMMLLLSMSSPRRSAACR